MTIPEQLLNAMRQRNWSVRQLLEESKLRCDRSSLQRKLKGEQPLDPDEIQALVNALEISVAVVPRNEGAA